MTLTTLVHHTLLVFGLIAVLLIAMVGTEALFWVATPWRSLLFWLLVLAAGGLVTVFVIRPLLRLLDILPQPPDREVAQHISTRYPDLEDRLVNLLDIGEGRASEAPAPMVDGAVQMLHSRVQALPLEQAASFSAARRTGRLASIPVAGLLIFLLAAPGTFLGASQRLFSPGVLFERPAPFVLTVTPGDITIVRGDTLTITAFTTGAETPHTATLQLDQSQPLNLTPTGAGQFSYTVINVREEMRYRVQADDVSSGWFDVTVLERPVVRGLQLTLVAPPYTGLPIQVLSPGTGDVVALPGTEARVEVQSGNAQAYMVFASGRVDTLSQGTIAKGTFTVRAPDSYHVLLISDTGIRNLDPITYQVTPLVDLMPTVSIRAPATNAILDLEAPTSVLLQLSDDFGFRDLNLWWRLAESRYADTMGTPIALSIPLVQPQLLDQQITFLWDLATTTELDIVPGDVIEYYAEVRDNDVVRGYKAARSALHRLRMPSISERYNRLGATQQETETELDALLDASERIRDQFEEVRDELRRNQQGDWNDQRQLERLTEAQRELEARVEDVISSMEETSDEMQGLVSDETLQMFDELRQVAEEINSPELLEAMQELQQAIESLNPRAMQEALDRYGFNEEQYRDRLERTLELFRNFQVQQKLEEAAHRAENLAAEQEQMAQEIADDTEAAHQEREALADQQMRNKEEMEQLEAHMEEIARRMEAIKNAPRDAMSQLNEETQAQQLPEQMQENAQQMQAGQMQQAQLNQQNMQQSLQQLNQNLQGMMEGMQGNQQQINFTALQHILSNVLRLSHDQEALRRLVDEAAADSPLLRQFAQRQSMMREGMEGVADSLQSLARQIPQMSRAVQAQTGTALLNMETAVTSLAARNSTQATREQQTAMTNLNELALLLSDLMDQLMNASNNNSSGGMSMSEMIQQMQQMAQQQQQINQQIQEMLGQMQGQRLTPDMQARMQQIAEQQQALQQQLEELSRQRALAERLAGDINRIAAQMEETVRQLEEMGGINQRTLQERQQQILTRLLDASRAMQERGKERKREGRTGEMIERLGPDALEISPPEEALRRALLDALESGYTPDYQKLIRRYFEQLQEIH